MCLNTIADFVEPSLVCVVPEDPRGDLRMWWVNINCGVVVLDHQVRKFGCSS